jgi:hypothetical protein
MLARPRVLATMVGLDGESSAVRWLPRLLAVRELALGVAAFSASRRTGNPLPWLCTLAVIDAAEAIVVIAAIVDGAFPRNAAGRSSLRTLAARSQALAR